MYINPETLSNQSNPAPGLILLTDEQEVMYLQYNGFVMITPETDDAGAVSYTVEPDLEAWEAWKESLPTDPDPGDESGGYIPTAEQSAVVMMRSAFAMQAASMEDEEILKCSGLASDWAPGDHQVSEVFNTRNGVHAEGEAWDQTWEVFQAYDNAVFPEIKPGNSSWYTFNRPLHGKSRETARPFVPVQGSHDMYRAGEYTVWTDGKTYRCKKDTAYSPADQADAWEVADD